MSFVYYLYAVLNPSDSNYYYQKVITYFRGPNWSDFYGTSTTFIEWTGYPFINYLGFSYEAIMALFAFFGWIGFIYFYKFFREQISFRNEIFGYDLLVLVFLLPNLHFWSGSFGKGSFIFLGIGLMFYGLGNIKSRMLYIVLGGALTYHIRPHIMLVVLISAIIGFTFSNKGVGLGLKILMIAIAVAAFAFIYQDVLSMVGIEQGEELTQGLDLTHRATELQKATSGVDITNYSLPLQVFTFLFRPLFFDAPGMLGLIVSFENVFLLYIAVIFLTQGGLTFLIKGDFLVKTAFLSFITVSIALAQISGNLGIAIRQKSQVMMLFLFVIIKLMDEKKMKDYKRRYANWKRKQLITQQQEALQQ
ncbi:hypothetical protein LVD15_16220 [Fulvivirga maritima]|uniref:hypothetical protein n=1 Tax=Fulvivirga maritima TaxID=2904247 RepID=UPI001F301369|nr:hypothetical protein [Fulvivirga maritima]UII24847.1 hypothetical protein LVD15_16220 [Fulvivirga maritima]